MHDDKDKYFSAQKPKPREPEKLFDLREDSNYKLLIRDDTTVGTSGNQTVEPSASKKRSKLPLEVETPSKEVH